MSAQWIDARMFDALSAQAQDSVRRRRNFNFHPTDHYPSNRLLNAIEPDSYVPPHRHLDPTKDETLFVLRGSIGVLLFDNAGTVVDQRVIIAGGDTVGIDIPHRVIHSLVALEPGTIAFEAKAGPFADRTPAELLSFAPAEASPGAVGYLAWMRSRFD